ncbi:MBL fold metallo-hydrolase [Gaetbulibacter sp. PBL-D1]|uniref:MBL fold metallo-hydrolase n=1 Tax=Gaetbulibacter sp. PBL-D1 TaxID=3422594 RepID=UPI003D2F3B76
MRLKVIGTGSKGNAYLLYNEEEALLIECGVGIKAIKQALNFDLSKLVACIVTHEHGDHAKSMNDLMAAGINVYATSGTHDACGTRNHHRALLLSDIAFLLGRFMIKKFDIKHDAAEPCGFLINHPECGTTLFLTDAIYSAYTFKGLNNIIIEANYDPLLAKHKLGDMEFLRNRIINNHMSIDTCIDALKANDLTAVNNIVLIHLSDSNSNEADFKRRVQNATGKTCTVASNGLDMNFNKTPF